MGIILALYILFAIFKTEIFKHWLSGNELSAFGLCLSAGIMLGRFLTVRKRVIAVLKQHDKIYKVLSPL